MSNPARPAERRHEFVLAMTPPLRSYLLAGVYALVGAVLVVVSVATGWPWVITVIGVALVVLGLVLGTVAVAVLPRLRTTLIMEPAALTLVDARRRRTLPWTDVSDVTVNDTRLVFRGRDPQPDEVVLYDLRRTDPHAFRDTIAAVQVYLDASRGYRN